MKGYQLKAIMEGSMRPIWRRLLVPAQITFSQLHQTLQAAFERTESGWYEFDFVDARVGSVGEQGGLPQDGDVIDAECQAIDELMGKCKKFDYLCGRKGCWRHRIEVEKVVEFFQPNYPSVTQYSGASVPEEYEGIKDYNNQMERRKKPSGEGEVGGLEWGDFKKYDACAVNDYMREKLNFPISGAKDVPDNVDESMKEFWEFMQTRGQGETLEDIFEFYSKDEIKMIAKKHEIKNISKLNKGALIERVASEILKKERMERFFVSAPDYVIEVFEEAVAEEGRRPIDITREFDYLFEGGYCGIDGLMRIYIPREVINVYKTFGTPEFHEKRKAVCKVLMHCHMANTLYAVSPISVVVDLYNRYEKEKVEESYIMGVCQEVLPEVCDYVCRGDALVDRFMLKEDLYLKLVKGQKNVPFYMPAKREVTYYFQNGYLETPKEYKELYQFLMDELDVEYYEEAYELCQVVHTVIRNGCHVQDLLQLLDEQEIEVSSGGQVKRLMEIYKKLWLNTRMIIYRGHSPKEMDVRGKRRNDDKVGKVAERPHGNSKVVHFPGNRD